MTTPEFIRQQLAAASASLQSIVWRLLFFTRVSSTSADGSADGVEGWPGTEGDPASPQQTARRMEPWGVHGRPPAGIQALIARVLAGAGSALQVGIWTGAHGRQNLAEGETQLYSSASGAEVWLDKDGNVNINAASGKDIIANGGTAKVGRVGDAINVPVTATATSLSLSVKDSVGVTGTLSISVAAGALVVALVPPTLLPPLSITGAIAAGADHLKG